MKYIWILLGFISLFLGTIGIVLPILPTVPFYMATVFCFARSSETLHNWFMQIHDTDDKMQDYGYGNSCHVNWIYMYEKCSYR